MSSESERRGEWHLQGMIFVSALLHVGLLLLLFLSPSFPSPKVTFGPVYTVSLVSTPANVLVQKSDSAVARELMNEKRPEMVLKKSPEASAAIPIRPMETRKKQETDLEKAMQEIRRKAAAKESTTPASAAKGAPAKTATPPAAASAAPGGGSDAQLDAQMRAYYAMIWSRIKAQWALPQGILPGEVLETVIHVTILRSGAVTEVNFEKRSGNRYFDESAMKAIRKASPFPPLTVRSNDSSIDVGIRFHSSELGS